MLFQHITNQSITHSRSTQAREATCTPNEVSAHHSFSYMYPRVRLNEMLTYLLDKMI